MKMQGMAKEPSCAIRAQTTVTVLLEPKLYIIFFVN